MIRPLKACVPCSDDAEVGDGRDFPDTQTAVGTADQVVPGGIRQLDPAVFQQQCEIGWNQDRSVKQPEITGRCLIRTTWGNMYNTGSSGGAGDCLFNLFTVCAAELIGIRMIFSHSDKFSCLQKL